MFRFYDLCYHLSVCLGIVFILSISSAFAFAVDRPEIFVQMGHSGSVTAVALSPDGKYVLTADVDGNIKLWDAAGGFEIRTYTGQNQRIFGLHFSPDGKLFLSNGHGGNLRSILWEVATGRQIRQFENAKGAFSSDGGQLLLMPEVKTDWSEGTFSVWDLSLGKQTVTSQFNPPEDKHEYAFSDDGRYVLVLTKDGHLALWDMRTQQKLKTFQGLSEAAKLTQKVIGVFRAVFSPDYKHVVTWSGYSPFPGEPPVNHDLELWDMAAGNKKTLKGHSDRIEAVAFSSDSRSLVSASMDGTIRQWETATGREMRTFGESAKKDAASSREWFSSAAFSADGKHILSGSGNEAKLWDVETGKMERIYTGQAQGVLSVVLSPDGSKAVLGKNDGSIDICDLPTGNIIKAMQAHSSGVYVVSVSSDGARLLSGSSDQTLKLWEFPTLNPLKTFSGFPHWVEAAAFSPDGKYAVSGDGEGYLRLFDLQSDREIRAVRDHNRRLRDVAFSPDGKYVLSRGFTDDDLGGGSHWIRLWNAGDLTLVREIGWGLISGDGRHALVKQSKEPFGTDPPRPFSILDVFTPKEEKTFTVTGYPLAVSPHRHYVLSKDSGNRLVFYDTITRKTHFSSAAHSSDVNTVAFSSDEKFTLSASDDGTARLWETASGREIARMISFTDGEWIVITPEGYFNASANGARHLSVRVGNNVYSIDNFYEKFYNPVHVASVLQGKKVETVADIRKGILSPPDIRITSPSSGKEFSTDALAITVVAKDTGGGIDGIRLYHNGKAIGEDQRGLKLVSTGGEIVKDYNVTLVDGVNTFRAVGFSKDRTESNPDELVVKLAAPSKDVSLYVFAVGINKYKNPALNLNYAEPDARGIAAFFKGQGKGLFKNVNIMEIYSEQATKKNILFKLSQLQNIKPQDAVLIYLAGHGENINDKWYFIPHELTYPEREEDVKIRGISSDELSGYMKNIKAQKILMLIDACKSGAVLIAFRGFEDRKALSQLSRSTGVHIVAASTKDQFAAEVKELGHGVFTYTLLEGLGGKASGRGEAVTVRKLMGYVEEKLPEITKKFKQEAQYPVVDSRGMDFPLVIGK
ncbi:MAG: caspase family protein [Syntrophales bacterium]